MQTYRGVDVRRTLEEVCDPTRLALLVYDMQAGVVGQVADHERVSARVAELLGSARAAGVRTVFTRHLSLPLEWTGASGLRTAMSWQATDDVDKLVSAFPSEAPQSRLVDAARPQPGELVVEKYAMSAFVGTPLDFVFRDVGIEAFAIVGVALEVGIEPTIRHGLDLGYLPVLVTDACGHGNADAAARSREQLAWFGGTIQTDTATLAGLLAAPSRP